ncbi:hypothetical protein Q4P03_42245, partial [Burkholderia cepacia]|nr:hypothetical protein [Burkholderia cepacia]
MNESTYRAIFGFVVIAYGAAISAIMAFRPERILAFYCRSRAWRWWYKFCFNMSAEDRAIVKSGVCGSVDMIRRPALEEPVCF